MLKKSREKGSEKSMRLLIDGNIILDVLQKRDPHYVDSSKVWKICESIGLCRCFFIAQNREER